jgi:hypothetical protein
MKTFPYRAKQITVHVKTVAAPRASGQGDQNDGCRQKEKPATEGDHNSTRRLSGLQGKQHDRQITADGYPQDPAPLPNFSQSGL